MKPVPHPTGWLKSYTDAGYRRVYPGAACTVSGTQASTITKSLDITTVNALFSDEDTLTKFIISPTRQSLPDVYRFENFDPKVDRIRALTKELFLSGGESL